jgi:hypothetical protein
MNNKKKRISKANAEGVYCRERCVRKAADGDLASVAAVVVKYFSSLRSGVSPSGDELTCCNCLGATNTR